MKISHCFGALGNLMRLTKYRFLYGNKLSLGNNVIAYSGLSITIAESGCIQIGDNVFFNRNCSINSRKRICVGSNCLFGENVCIYDHNHEYRDGDIPICKQGFRKSEVVVGNNCWIGSNVVILRGVHIGDHVVVGANSVIYKDIPDNTVVINSGNLIYKELEI